MSLLAFFTLQKNDFGEATIMLEISLSITQADGPGIVLHELALA